MSSPGQLETPEVLPSSSGSSSGAGPSTRNSGEMNLRMGTKEKTEHAFMKVSFDRYVSQISITSYQEAHEQRLKRLAEEARDLHKNEWQFTPIDQLLGNWVQ